MSNIVKIENLSFAYEKNNVLENIDLEIKHKDFLAIIGPNGGGKSTLLKLILDMLVPKNGKIKRYVEINKFGYVPQNTNLNTNFPITSLEVVLMGQNINKRRLFGYSKEEINIAKESLEKVGMLNFSESKIGSLSGGQRQRVFIARALCTKPEAIFLDEPTASIDVKGQKEIYDLLKELSKNITVVVISHDISVLLNYANNVAHINKNLVYHHLHKGKNELFSESNHLCEVELLTALGKNEIKSCCHA